MAESAESLRRTLDRLGVRGRVIFVQSSWRALRQVVGTPQDAIAILCDSVGEEGTVVMPAFPMVGSSQQHLEEHPFFDCRHTPSKTGALTEVFRKTAGVVRSLHPTHSVVASGRMATELTEGAERSPTPFDSNSPFHRMYEADGLGVTLGVHLSSFNHLADHHIQESLPHDVYAEHAVRVRLVDCIGVESHMETRGHNPRIRSRSQATLDVMARGSSHRWLLPVRRAVLGGAVMDRRHVGPMLVGQYSIRSYVHLYRWLHRIGVVKYESR